MNLSEAPIGAVVRIEDVAGVPRTRLRLAELGLRPGESVAVSHRTSGGGRVVSVDHGRIALDKATLQTIAVTVQDPPTSAGRTMAAARVTG